MLECRIKKPKLLLALTGAGVFVVLGLLLVTGVISGGPEQAEVDRIGGIVIGWLVILFFGGIALYAVISQIKYQQGPVIRIDETGFFDRRISNKVIPWSAIRSARIFRGKTVYAVTLRFISLDVAHPENYIKTGAAGRLFTPLLRLFKQLYDEPGITIATTVLDRSPDAILAAIGEASKGAVKIDA